MINNFSSDVLLGYENWLLQMKSNHPVLLPVLFICCYSVLVAFSISITAVLNVVAGYLFGPVAGALLASLGVVSGSYMLFLFTRSTVSELSTHLKHRRDISVNSLNDFFILFFMRLSPFVPGSLVTIGSAVVRMKDSLFLAATFLGSIPLLFVYAMIGKQLGNIHHMHQVYDSSLSYILVLFAVVTFVPLMKQEVREQLKHSRRRLYSWGFLSSGEQDKADQRAIIRISSRHLAALFNLGEELIQVKIISEKRDVVGTGQLLDINKLGMGIRLSENNLKKNEQVRIETEIDGEIFSILAVVRWISKNRLGVEYLDPVLVEQYEFFAKIPLTAQALASLS
ncbi:MAG: TVP38/TMEM64 family protein [Thermodesulfobacteria bacterium]|nr:TVP38/TMEM64 family protein [Thermodesulfobacteriota bacterium]